MINKKSIFFSVYTIVSFVGIYFGSTIVLAQSYDEMKRLIIDEVYSSQEYLPLIDIQQATVDLNSLTVSLDRIEDQVSLRTEQQDTINARTAQLRIAIATILKDTKSTEQDIRKVLQSIAILKKKIASNEVTLQDTREDLIKHRGILREYLRFVYITRNRYGASDEEFDTLRLLLQDHSVAESLSQQNFLKLLTQNISSLLGVLHTKEVLVDDLLETMRSDTQSYIQAGGKLKEHLGYLNQQKKSVYELMSYLQQESVTVEGQIGRIANSKEALVRSKRILEKVVNGTNGVQSGELYEVIQDDDRSLENNFYSWPFVGEPLVTKRFDAKNESIRFELPQSTPLYSPAAGIVHEVQWSESSDLAWIVILHKQGYATFFASLSEVFVKPGQIVKRGLLIGRSGGKPGTRGSGIDSVSPHVDMTVMKSGKAIDPLTMLDLSVFDELAIVGKYQKDYIQDQGMRQVYVSAIDRMSGLTIEERAKQFLSIYARGAFADPALRYQGSNDTGINPVLGMCIGFAETSFKNFKTPNNIGNVGNDDRGRTVTFATPLQGVKALFNVFNNQYLSSYMTLNQLSRFGNDDGFIYASSSYNRQKNIMNCLTSVYGYRVPEDFPFRVPVVENE